VPLTPLLLLLLLMMMMMMMMLWCLRPTCLPVL
jgi:hypothetical protein